ncbi:MAG: hypothetical protein E5V91_19780 [Mesorhizobium sp.]|nr:MAG: hypothetical protein E5V91_19780 [Mesorhizobium sp.]
MPILLIPAGMILGLLVGYANRPSHIGFQIPLEVLFSANPMDAPFRSELMTHLMSYGAIGLVGGVVLFGIVRAFLPSRKS